MRRAPRLVALDGEPGHVVPSAAFLARRIHERIRVRRTLDGVVETPHDGELGAVGHAAERVGQGVGEGAGAEELGRLRSRGREQDRVEAVVAGAVVGEDRPAGSLPVEAHDARLLHPREVRRRVDQEVAQAGDAVCERPAGAALPGFVGPQHALVVERPDGALDLGEVVTQEVAEHARDGAAGVRAEVLRAVVEAPADRLAIRARHVAPAGGRATRDAAALLEDRGVDARRVAEGVGGGEPGRAGPDHGHALARRGRAPAPAATGWVPGSLRTLDRRRPDIRRCSSSASAAPESLRFTVPLRFR